MNNTKELAAFKWQSILSNFMDAKKFLSGHHGPCPMCGGKDRFRFEPDKEAGGYFCSHCGAGTGIHLLSQLKGIEHKEAWKLVEAVLPNATESKPAAPVNREARIKKILAACHPIVHGGEVWTYLHNRGIINTPEGLQEATASSGATMMVGRFALGKKLVGLHITFLRNGQKDTSHGSSKKMYGLTKGGLNGSAIRLYNIGTGSRIAIAEGIETALSVHQLQLPVMPVWATGSAGLMEAVAIPDTIKEVVIYGDNDSSFTGQAAAFALAQRLTAAGKYVSVHLPDGMDTDFNDILDKPAKS